MWSGPTPTEPDGVWSGRQRRLATRPTAANALFLKSKNLACRRWRSPTGITRIWQWSTRRAPITGNQERRRLGMADSERIHTFFLSPPTHRTRGWFLSTHSRVACASVGRNNVMLCVMTGAGARLPGIGKRTRLAGVDDGSYTTEAHVKNRKGARYDGAWGSRKIL